MKVAGAQIPVTTDVESNLRIISRSLDVAVKKDADILLTPEGSLSGYTHKFFQEEVRNALEEILNLAKGKIGLALGTCFKEADGHVYNQIRFYSQKGEYLGFHSKILLTSTLTQPPRGEINNYSKKPLRVFTFKDIIIGGLICNDMWANPCCTYKPENLSQKLSLLGAKIVFHSVNGGRNKSEFSRIVNWNFHDSNLRMRAKAGKFWVVTVDNCHPTDQNCSSPGGVINPDGNWVTITPLKGEHIFFHNINL